MIIHAGNWLHFEGDSITVGTGWNEGNYPWYNPPGGVLPTIQATWPGAVVQQNPSTVSGSQAILKPGATPAIVQPVITTGKQVSWTWDGQAGATAAMVANNLVNLGLPQVPKTLTAPILVLQCGINDAAAIVNSTGTLLQFQTGYNACVSEWLTVFPAGLVIGISAYMHGETWVSGPAWDPANAFTSAIVSVNNAMQTILAGLGSAGAYVDLRTPALAWEVANNPGAASSGFATVDGTHPKIVGMTSIFKPAFFGAVSVAP